MKTKLLKPIWLAAMLLLLSSVPLTANAHDFEVGGIYYLIDGTNATVTFRGTSYSQYSNEYSGNVVIPESVTYNGTTYPVTSIGNSAFYSCSGLTSVTIPNSVTSIGYEAFYYCSGLTSVTIGNSVTSIGWRAFEGCSGLTSITIPNSVTSINESAFEWCSGLTSITIPNSVTSIGENAFMNCSNIETLNINNNAYASISLFSASQIKLKTLILGNSVTSIGESAFYGCSGLTSVTIGNSVTSIGSSAFQDCSGLTNLTWNAIICQSRGDMPTSNIENVTIGDQVQVLPGSFVSGSKITSVTIPNSVTSIGDVAFSGCSGLTSVNIPNSVTSIDNDAFFSCNGLESIVVDNGNGTYDSRDNCNAIIETATNELIAGCKNTVIPNSVTSIGKYAFYGCSGLTSITIPNSVTSIGDVAFYGCNGLETIVVDNGNPSYDSRGNCNALIETATNELIAGCKNTVIPNSVTSIGNYAFDGCSGLTSITIGNSVASIGPYAFRDCSGLTSIDIPNSVISIHDGAFEGCSGLTSVTIPNSVTSIGGYAFYNCSGLTRLETLIENPASVSLGSDVFKNINPNCTLVVPLGTINAYSQADQWKNFLHIIDATYEQPIVFEDSEVERICINNWDTNGDGFLSYAEAASVTSLGEVFKNNQTITSFNELQYFTGLTSIGTMAFHGCSGLTSIIIPNSVNSIGLYAFEYCSGLTSIIIPNSVNSIRNYAFNGCSGLTSIDIPNTVTSIAYRAFYKCSGLTSITIGNSVTYIGERAFYNCSGLTRFETLIENPASVSLGSDVFMDINPNCTLVVPPGTFNAYSQADQWKDFSHIIDDAIVFEDSEVERICLNNWDTNGDGFLSYTEAASVTSLGEVFKNNQTITSFNELQYFTGLTSIGIQAFNNCSGLTSITIPNSVNSIGSWAFSGCRSLESIVVDNGNSAYDSRNNCNAIIETATSMLIAGCKNTVIPNSITSIGDFAFEGCSELTSITIPNSVISIGDDAFRDCSGLTSIDIPNSVISIHDGAFYGCSGLTSVTIPNSVTSIDKNAFRDCSGLTSVHITDIAAWCNIAFGNMYANPVEYAHHLFLNSNEVKDLVIPNSVTSIGDNVFESCSGLTSVTIPNSVTSIGYGAFYGCSGLTSLSIPNSVTSIGDYAFQDCSGLTSVTIGNSVTSIGNYAFSRCSGLTGELVIPNSVTSIGKCAFYQCSGLTSVTIGNSVTSIGYGAFYGCSGLTSVNIPNSVTSIGDYAFQYCSGLTSLTIGNSVTSIGVSAFGYCSGLTGELVIPNSVTAIGDFAFEDCSELTSIIIGNSVTSIGYAAFADCSSLTGELVIPNSVTAIGDFAFEDCSELTSIIIGNSVTSIGIAAFSRCSGLTSVTIPNSVTSIGQLAFRYCSGLTSIYNYINHPTNVTLGSDVFYEVNKTNCTLYVTKGRVNEYRDADQWKDFANIVEGNWATGISIKINPLTLYLGATATLQVQHTPTSAPAPPVLWQSSDTTIATVDQNGKVTAVALGQAIITATTTDATALSDSCRVNVTGITGIVMNKSNTILYLNETDSLTATVAPADLLINAILWQSSDTTVATVDQNGVVTAHAVGNATITAKANDGPRYEVLEEIHATGCPTYINTGIFTSNDISVEVKYNTGSSLTNNARIFACSTSWNSPQTMAVDYEGDEIKYKFITQTSWNSSNIPYSPNQDHTVYLSSTEFKFDDIQQSTFSPTTTSGQAEIRLLQSQLGADINSEQGYYLVYYAKIWDNDVLVRDYIPVKRISDNVYGMYDQVNNVFYPSAGSKQFTGTSKSIPEFIYVSDSCMVEVRAYATGITLDKTQTSIYVGGNDSIAATVLPENAYNKTLLWQSSDTTVATVDQTGKVTAVALGQAVITATAADGSGVSASCQVNVTGITSIVINKPNTILYLNETDSLTATIAPADVIVKSLLWQSSNSAIATVDQNGVVTAHAVGTAIITVSTTDGTNLSDSCMVDVRSYVTGITLNKTQTSIYVGGNETITATVLPENAYNRGLMWQSSDPNVATVDQTGKVTAVTLGQTVITATAADGSGVSASCQVNVTGITSIALNKTSTLLYLEETDNLTATITPADVIINTIAWTSSNPSVASVNQNGKVTAHAVGTAIITATTTDGTNLTASCAVEVRAYVSSVTLDKTRIDTYVGGSETITATVLPENAYNRGLQWQTSNLSVASVDQNGKVTATGLGTAIIVAKTTDGSNLMATCEVNVTGVTSLTLDESDITLFAGTSQTLVATISPSDVIVSTLQWQSSDPTVATVNQNGKVVALAAGTATITATTTDGTNLSASCQVTVWPQYALVAPGIEHTRGEQSLVVEYAVEMFNKNAITGLQFEMQLPDSISLMDDSYGYPDIWLDENRRARNHSVDVTELGDNYYKVMISSPTNKEFKGNSGNLFYMRLLVDKYHASGIYNIGLTGIVLAEPDETEHQVDDTSFDVQYNYMLGDADADVHVDVGDYITTALYIMNKPTIRFYEDAANVHTANDAINVTDLTGITNIALGIRPTEILHAPALGDAELDDNNEPELGVSVKRLDADRWMMSVDLSNRQPMAAMQLDLQLPDGVSYESASLTDRAGKLQLTDGILPDGTLRLLMSAFSADDIEAGEGDVINIVLKGNPVAGGMATFHNMIVAERNLNSYEPEPMMVPFVPTAIDGATLYNEVRIYGEKGNVVIESPVAGTAQLVLLNGIATPLEVQPGRNTYPVNSNEYYIVRFNGTTAKL